MKNDMFLRILLIVPLLLGFSTDTTDHDVIRLNDFHIAPFQYTNAKYLTFSFTTTSRNSQLVSVSLSITNSTYENRLIGQEMTTLYRGLNKETIFYIPPHVATSGINTFTLTFASTQEMRTLSFYVGAYGNATFTLPTLSFLRDMFRCVTYKSSTFIYSYYMFDYDHLLDEWYLSDDLLINPLLFRSSFLLDEQAVMERIELVFVDKAYLFPRLEKTVDGHPFVELSMYYEKFRLHYELLNPLYVDYETHLISPQKDEGFMLTSSIYLPKNRIDDLEFGGYELRIYGFTSLKINIIYRFTLSFARNYFASDGTYDFEYGWF